MLKRVDFYAINVNSNKDLLKFACKLINKVYRQKYRLLILLKNQDSIKYLDELLWSFDETSFIPHSTTTDENIPILINDKIIKNYNVLLNLTNEIPQEIDYFDRVIEIVSNQIEDSLINSRKKYKQYKNEKIELNYHKLPL